jgi:hypothetical protein
MFASALVLAFLHVDSVTPIGTPGVPDKYGPGGGGATPGPALDGTDLWFDLPALLAPDGTPTRVVAGDWNRDGTLDAALLIDGRAFVVVGPDVFRGALELDALGSVNDLEALPGGGPLGQDAVVTVGPAGLLLHHFDNGTGNFGSTAKDVGVWAGARMVRVADLAAGAPLELIGVDALGTSVLGLDVETGQGLVIVDHGAEIVDLGAVDWAGGAAAEIAVLSKAGLTVYDNVGLVVLALSSAPDVGLAFAVVRRALEPHERLAWLTRDAGDLTTLHVVGQVGADPDIALGRLSVVSAVTADLDGDASDELFLSHHASPHQVVLVSQAVVGDAQSPTYAAGEYELLTVLEPEVVVGGDAFEGPGGPTWNGGPGGQGGSGGSGGFGGSGSVKVTQVPGGPALPAVPAVPGGPGTAGGGPPSGPIVAPGRLGLPAASSPDDDANPFARNRARPALADFDSDGDVDVLFPISRSGRLLLHRNARIDEGALKIHPGSSSLEAGPGDDYFLSLQLAEPASVPGAATHVEVVVWFASSMYAPVGTSPIGYWRHAITGEWVGSIQVLIPEAAVPSPYLYHVQTRLIEEALSQATFPPILQVWPSSVSTYAPSKSVYESLAATTTIRGGGETTPKTGPVFVGGVAPRPFLDAFMPGIMPRAPGGGQVQ